MRREIWWLIAGLTLLAVGIVVLGLGLSGPLYDRAGTKELTVDSSVPEPLAQESSDQSGLGGTHFVPILMYHYIRDYQNADDPLGIELSVSPAKFDQQLATLKSAGYTTISLVDFIEGRLAPQSIILTFDDGYLDHFTDALPLLQKYNYTATFFIVTGFLGRGGYMTQDQVNQLAEAHMEIGGHTITHLNLANASYERAVNEIFTSLRNKDPVFAYPSGKYKDETIDILSGLKVKAAVTTDIGVATEKSHPLKLPRIRVKEKTDLLKRINEETAIAKSELSASQRSHD